MSMFMYDVDDGSMGAWMVVCSFTRSLGSSVNA